MGRVRFPSIIDRNGTVDETDNILDFVASQPDGTRIVISQDSEYRIDRTLEFTDRNGLVIQTKGAPARIFAGTNGDELGGGTPTLQRKQIRFLGGDRCGLRNIYIQGANPFAGTGDAAYNITRESQHGIQLQGVTNWLGDRITVTDVAGDYIYIGPRPGTFVPSVNIHVRRFHFERNGRQGISVIGGYDMLFEDGYLGENRRAAVDVEPNDPIMTKNLRLRRVTIGPTRLNMFSNVGDLNAPCEDITFERTLHTGRSGPDHSLSTMNSTLGTPSVTPGLRKRYSYIRCVSTENRGTPNEAVIAAYFIDDILIEECIQPMESGRNMRMVRIGGCSGTKVIGGLYRRATGIIRQDGMGGNTNFCTARSKFGSLLEATSNDPACSGG